MNLTAARPAIQEALTRSVQELGIERIPDLELTRSRNPSHGDYSTSVAMKLSRDLRKAPPVIAAELAPLIELEEATAEAVGGYVNFRLRPEWLRSLVVEVAATPDYGSRTEGGGRPVPRQRV